MSKINLIDVESGYNLSRINENFKEIKRHLDDKVLYRDNPIGEPNSLESDIDVNSKRLYNLPAPTSPSEAARLKDIQDAMSGASSAALVSFEPYGNIESTNVQGAIQEVEDSVIAIEGSLSDLVSKTELASDTGSSLVGFKQEGTGSVLQTVTNKLQERVSVKDFGAVGDGIADDTAAINLALASSKYIEFGSPNDHYKISGSLILQDEQIIDGKGAKITQTGVQTPMFLATNKTGITIKNGNFFGNATEPFVNSPSSQCICISAQGANKISVIHNKFTNFLYSSFMNNSGGDRIEFSHNTVIGPGSAVLGVSSTYKDCTGVTVIGTNIRIEGNDISQTAQGIILGQGSYQANITGNVIHDLINEHGIYADTGLNRINISNNVISYTGNQGTGIKVQSYDSFGILPQDITISGNAIAHTGSDGIQINNTTAGGGTLLATGVSITGNTIYQARQHGINVRYARGCVVSGNSIEQTLFNAIYLDKSSVVNIIGNSIRVTGDNAIFDVGTSSDVTYDGNIINNFGTSEVSGHCGLYIQGCSEHVIQNNVIRGIPAQCRFGVAITGGTLTTTVFKGNIITGTGRYGADFSGGSGQLRYQGENKLSGALGEDTSSLPEALVRGSMIDTYYGTASPVSGTWPQGARVLNRYPSAGGFTGWVCVVGGTPGTWKTFGAVSA